MSREMLKTDGSVTEFSAHGRRFQAKRLLGHATATYHLRDLAVSERSRFGTRKQILEDIRYAQDYGFLPPPAGPRW